MGNVTSSGRNSGSALASIPMAGGGLARLAVARLKTAGVPVTPLLRRVGLTPEVIAKPEERLSVRSQIAFLDEAAIALKDDCIGFTLARNFDLRELGLLYYVMASSQALGDALTRVARYSKITNEALVVGYREGNTLIINLSYSGVPRHSDIWCVTNLPSANGEEACTATLRDFSLSIRRHLRNGAICWNQSGVRR